MGRSSRSPGVQTDDGQALVLFAAGLLGLLAIIALSVDVGQLVYTRTDLQKVADAAALAGAQELPDTAKAYDVAMEYVALNAGPDTTAEITFSNGGEVIHVKAQRDVDYLFASLVGNPGGTVSAKAAVQSVIANGFVFDETDVFPYAVWGGNPPDGSGCPFNLCFNQTQVTYRSNSYRDQVLPDHDENENWDVDSNKFKGYFHHGGEVVYANDGQEQTFSYGGNAIGQEPIDALSKHYNNGSPIVLPVIAEASDCRRCPNGNIKFKIVGWVSVNLDQDPATTPTSQDWTGTVVGYASSKGYSNGGYTPPEEWQVRAISFVE